MDDLGIMDVIGGSIVCHLQIGCKGIKIVSSILQEILFFQQVSEVGRISLDVTRQICLANCQAKCNTFEK